MTVNWSWKFAVTAHRQALASVIFSAVVSVFLGFTASLAHAATYYVAPTGSDSNAGTLAQPFATMARGQQAAVAGDTIYLRGGTYKFSSNTSNTGVALNKSGTSGNRINYWAYQNEVPILDFSGITTADRITGLRVTASWIYLKGLEVKLVPQNITTQNESWGIYNDGGNNNIYEMLNLHHNMGPGFFLGSGGNNLILNCDSHHNYDPKSKAGDGENADGFGCHPKAGNTGNVFRGIRAWWNTDDGYDSINAFESCLVENSWSWLNGYLPDTMTLTNRDPNIPPGNGNGFKLGGYGINGTNSPASPPKHTIRFSVAFLNAYAGFFANYHTTGNYYYGNTGFMNAGADFNMLGLTANTSLLRNNLAYGPSPTANMNGTDAMYNSWNLPVQVTEADFQSISTMGMDGPRQADGSLPVVPFMRLVAGSDLIDKGVNINMGTFTGAAPDLGAFEFSGVVVATGGAGGGFAGGGGAGGGALAGTGGGVASGGAGGGTGVGSGGSGAAAGVTGGAPGSGGAGAAGVASGGAIGSGGDSSTGGASTGGASAGTGGTGAGTTGATGGASATGGQSAPAATSGSSGCACRVAGGRGGGSSSTDGVASLVLALALTWGRRRVCRRHARADRRHHTEA